MKKVILLLAVVLGLIFIGGMKLSADDTKQVNEVKAEHILVATQKEAAGLKQKIENKEISFEEAAKKYSKCPSGAQGGDLGYFKRGVMVKPFEEAAFNANVNEVSQPVQTQFGWHLIKVVDKK